MLQDPALYRLRTRVRFAGEAVDETSMHIGFRYFHFDAHQGFFFNGKPLKLQGVCLHQDHAGVGVAVPDSLWEFRLRKLKELGVNAIRCSHMVRRMAAAVKRLDDTRPVTAAMNDGVFATVNVSQAVDVVGFNYQQNEYDRFHAANPTLPILSSEDTSSFMTRGEYRTDREKNIMGSYDEEPASWGATHREATGATLAIFYIAETRSRSSSSSGEKPEYRLEKQRNRFI
jgi:hypothetical protein